MSEAPLEHRRCGCPEQYKGRDCPACRGTGLIPPVTRDEWVRSEHDLHEAQKEAARYFAGSQEWAKRAEALRQENERLREALELAEKYARIAAVGNGMMLNWDNIEREFRAALRKPEEVGK